MGEMEWKIYRGKVEKSKLKNLEKLTTTWKYNFKQMLRLIQMMNGKNSSTKSVVSWSRNLGATGQTNSGSLFEENYTNG